MTISRRSLLGGSAAAAATAAFLPSQESVVFSRSFQPSVLPSPAIIALNRIAYGPRPGDIAHVSGMGLAAYLEEQLNPVDSEDTDANTRIANATLRINYGAGSDYPAVDEMRPLNTLNMSYAELWQIAKHPAFAERVRPVDEMRAATWLRAMYSKWQLREVMMEFWVNHFNVHARSDSKISATWPWFIDKILRVHCFGNFRVLLEEVAKSVAMQYYLDNVTSRDGPANENYARELFELHTLGSDHYYNNLYDRWNLVPGAAQGTPDGYIDVDVYEAARAFTGWTIADGRGLGGGLYLPDTGEFHYLDSWHDNAQKRVLAREFDHNTPPLEDGKRVLDLLAGHAGTARYVCRKLCQRLVADQPPGELVDHAVNVWLANVNDPEQIKKTIRAIVLSPQFSATWGQKVKRPFEVFVSYMRATNAELTPDGNLFGRLGQSGYLMFDWPTPTGMPDYASYWLSTNGMLQRWNTTYNMHQSWFGSVQFDLKAQMPANATTSRQIVDFWLDRLLGYQVDQSTYTELLQFMSQGEAHDEPPTGSDSDLSNRLINLVVLIGMLPDFQQR